ncbi:uncharacterized protein DS421_13g428860 [Arachis hypogaea]|nr:uncharacterized protein DS421_13g428860 [Arachis hypogaea]
MHPPLTLHKHPMCAEIIELFQKCHVEHPVGKFFGECTDLKIKLDRCFRQEKALKRKANFEESKKFKEQLRAFRKENALNYFTFDHEHNILFRFYLRVQSSVRIMN